MTQRRLIRPFLVLLGVCLTPFVAQMHAQMPSPEMQAPTGADAIASAGMKPMPKAPSQRSEMLTLTIQGRSLQLTVGDLERMPQTSVTVNNEHTHQQESYRGVAVKDLLGRLGVMPDAAHHQQILRSYLRAQGTDFYFVLYAATELVPAMHSGDVIVATSMNGSPLAQDGRFKLVSTDDKQPARWVRNLNSLTLVTVN